MENTLALLKDPAPSELVPARPTNQQPAIWVDYRDDLLDALKEQMKNVQQHEKEGYLSILQILDVAERIMLFSINDTGMREKSYRRAHEKFWVLMTQIVQVLLNGMHRRKIKEIMLLPGMYPPIATTKIIHREDNQTTDDFVISNVAEKGYTWKTAVLRKASVIIITKQ